MPEIATFDEYISTLSDLGVWADPTLATTESEDIKAAAASLAALKEISLSSVADWANDNPKWARILGLAVGLSQEKLKTMLKFRLGSESSAKLAKERPVDLVRALDQEYHVLRLLSEQRKRAYGFGDTLVARAAPRGNAVAGAAAGRALEDKVEQIVRDLGLPYQLRTRFAGRSDMDAPCDLVIPAGGSLAVIAVASKVFGSTGSKQTAAFKEIEDMANVRKPTQLIMAVIEGRGWTRRKKDLARLHKLWAHNAIDGMYTVATLDRFRSDLEDYAN